MILMRLLLPGVSGCSGTVYPKVSIGGAAEPAGGAFDLFDEPVDAFGAGVGDAGVEECLDRRPPSLHGAGQGAQLVDVGGGTPVVEDVEPFAELVTVRGGAGECK